MKKIKLNKGLQINRDVVSKLQEEQMKDVKGGAAALSCLVGNCCNGKEKLEEAIA